MPVPCRFVSFAGHYAEQILAEVEEVRPALVVYDTFSVIGHVVGRMLGVPYVNVCAGHNMEPAERRPAAAPRPEGPHLAALPAGGRDCCASATGLRTPRRSPTVSGLSPFLNVYCEPPAYLTEAERRPFEPIAFYGSLPPLEEIDAAGAAPRP